MLRLSKLLEALDDMDIIEILDGGEKFSECGVFFGFCEDAKSEGITDADVSEYAVELGVHVIIIKGDRI
jgi:hypothetical protein